MSKLKTFIAALLLIPSLAFAGNQCDGFTDQNFSDMLTSNIISDEYVTSFNRLSVTVFQTIEFHKDGTIDEHAIFTAGKDSATFDAKWNWNIMNAILNVHVVSVTHSDAHNAKINKVLDEYVKEYQDEPDVSIPVGEIGLCDGKPSARSIAPLSIFLNK